MADSSAHPDDLDAYAAAATDQVPRLRTRAGTLKTALDALRSSTGRAEFLADVPEIDLDIQFFGDRWFALGSWMGDVAGAFRSADADGDGEATLDDSALDAAVGRYDPPEALVRLDGDRVIFDAGAGDDDMSVFAMPDGRVVVTVNGERHILEGDAARALTLRGNAGDDTIDAAGPLSFLWPFAVPGALTLDGGAGNDRIRGGRGNETIRGDRGDDEIDAGAGDDTVLGGDGDDEIDAGAGDDTILAGLGDDTVRGRDGDDVIRTGDGDDEIDGDAGDDDIDAGDGRNTVRGGTGHDTITTGSGDDRVEGGAGHDLIDTGEGGDTVLGGEGHDNIDSGAGRDYVDGGSGVDVVTAGEGDDVVYGGDDTDVIDAGAGRDYVDGGAGDDRLTAGEGDDIVSGGEGDDTIFAGEGDDVVYTGPDEDFALGGEGDDTLYVQDDDTIYASDPGDTVTEVAIDLELVDRIEIEGPPEYVQRIRADLVTLASSPTAIEMLQALDDAGDSLKVTAADPSSGAVGTYGGGEVRYSVEILASSGGPRPPIATLYHELAHAYDDFEDVYAEGVYLGPNQGQVPEQVGFDDDGDGVDDRTVVLDTDGDGDVTPDELDRDGDGDIDDDDLDLNGDGDVNRGDGWTPNLELQAVGIDIDHDQDPTTPDVPASSVIDHPGVLTENGLRREMHWPERTHY